ncbi:hypothetical protein PSHT_09203 [Puccinia striiformis]|uniref:AB hydrolase-1 domain-containing protein n=1 Tax=Puccinia striiformis TaxID=27350 RepID=A0A2S4VIE8_9BASI|nr:hypothetical protein PSHT_09203 [Puccinia striiformis]
MYKLFRLFKRCETLHNINGLKNVILIGHLMGGKVAMTLALESSISTHKPDSELIKKLIAVDISPAKGPISESFQIYIDGFKRAILDQFLVGKKPIRS